MIPLWRAALLSSGVGALLCQRLLDRGLFGSFSLLLFGHIVFLTIWKIFLWPLVFSPLGRLPEPKGSSILHGHAHLIPDERSGIPMNSWINDIPNDGLIRYRVKWNRERVFVTSPKGLSEVLVQKNYEFSKPYSLRLGLGRILGIGLIIAEGDEHKKQRRQLMPAFAHRHIKNVYPVFWSKSAELAKALTSVIATEGPKVDGGGGVVQIASWLPRATLDIIGVAGLGQDFHAIENPDNEVCNAYAGVFEQPPPKSKLVILKLLARELVASVLPIKRTDSVAIASETLKKVSRQLIQQKQHAKATSEKADDKDIISVALESGFFSQEQLVNQTLTFLAAGHETTATSMAWAILALCRNPVIQKKLREEVRSKLPSPTDSQAAPVSAELLDSLPYLHAVCSEVLRVYPPAGMTKRVAVKDTSILGQHIPKGTDIVIIMRAINHSTELWGEDAAEFKPERWLAPGMLNSGGASSNFAYMTFLHGPRSCIGQSFAKGEFACFLAVLVGCFEMELEDPSRPVEIVTGLTSRPRGGLDVRMKRMSGW